MLFIAYGLKRPHPYFYNLLSLIYCKTFVNKIIFKVKKKKKFRNTYAQNVLYTLSIYLNICKKC